MSVHLLLPTTPLRFPNYPSLPPTSLLRSPSRHRTPPPRRLHLLRPSQPRCSLTSHHHHQNQVETANVSAVLFDMDGVLCNSEEPSRRAAVDLFAEIGVSVTVDDFVPFTGTGEANFLGGVAKAKGINDFDTDAAKKRFFQIYLDKYAKPESGIGFPGALELVTECKKKGLKVAVSSSADRVKVDANLAAAGLPSSLFDAIISADAFENLKPAPDIFLAASASLNVPPSECVVIEDALAGVQAAKAANMRCIAVTTTLPQETLQEACPSLIKKDIGNISLHDVLEIRASSSMLFQESATKFLDEKIISNQNQNMESSDTRNFFSTGMTGCWVPEEIY